VQLYVEEIESNGASNRQTEERAHLREQKLNKYFSKLSRILNEI
jgi:hypothetical protein